MADLTTTVSTTGTGADVLDWVTAIGTIGAVLVALLIGLGFVDWFRRPKLRIESSADNPSDRVTTITTDGHPVVYLRGRVLNDGKTAAKNVIVTVLTVEQWVDTTRRWLRGKPELDGRPLAWSNVEHTSTVDIPQGVDRLVDLISIDRNWGQGQQGQMPMRMEIKAPFPVNRAEMLSPGAWRLRLEVSAENVSAKEYDLVLVFRGLWPADPPERVWQVIGVQGPADPGCIGQPLDPDTELARLANTTAELNAAADVD